MKARIPYRLTSAERKARDDEIKRQVVEQDRKFALENDAMVLWILHVVFKMGKKRLRRYFDKCFEEHDALREFYQFSNDEMGWLYTRKLKDIGVDIEAWYDEALRERDQKK